jgi:hypothetical protein
MTDMEAIKARVELILGEGNLGVCKASLEKYRAYLQENIVLSCVLTGREGFLWEEEYFYGSGDMFKHEELKKTKPSYKDHYQFISFDDQIDDTDGLMVKVKRISDREQFVLPLVDLKVTDDDSQNDQLVHDYVVWYMTY